MTARNSNSPALVLLSTSSRRVPVCGKNLEAALWAAALVDTVLRRGEEMPLPTSKAGGVATVRVTAQTLTRFLLDVLGDEPATVAEALMALRKFDPLRAAWLNRVLRKTPELEGLSRRVHLEVTGEEHGYAEGEAG